MDVAGGESNVSDAVKNNRMNNDSSYNESSRSMNRGKLDVVKKEIVIEH